MPFCPYVGQTSTTVHDSRNVRTGLSCPESDWNLVTAKCAEFVSVPAAAAYSKVEAIVAKWIERQVGKIHQTLSSTGLQWRERCLPKNVLKRALPLKLDTPASLPSMKSHSFKELSSTQTLRSRRRRFVFKVHALIVENLINFRPNHYTAVEFELITVIMAPAGSSRTGPGRRRFNEKGDK